MFDETDSDMKTSMPLKGDLGDDVKTNKLLFDKKVKKMKMLMHHQSKEEDAKRLKAKLLDENRCLLHNPELGSDSFFVAVAHFIPKCKGLEPADKAFQLIVTDTIPVNEQNAI